MQVHLRSLYTASSAAGCQEGFPGMPQRSSSWLLRMLLNGEQGVFRRQQARLPALAHTLHYNLRLRKCMQPAPQQDSASPVLCLSNQDSCSQHLPEGTVHKLAGGFWAHIL